MASVERRATFINIVDKKVDNQHGVAMWRLRGES
jgi:hypothetical protein